MTVESQRKHQCHDIPEKEKDEAKRRSGSTLVARISLTGMGQNCNESMFG